MGPGPTSLTKELIEHFDIVVRTNGFYDMTPQDQISPRCDVLMVNDIYTRNRLHLINLQSMQTQPQLILGYRKYLAYFQSQYPGQMFDYFDSNQGQFKGFRFTKYPLMLSRFIAYIWQYNPAELFISGVSFYSTTTAVYQPSYRNNLNRGPANHDPLQDIRFFKFASTICPWISFDPIIGSLLQIGLKISPTIEDYVKQYCKHTNGGE